MSYKYASNHAKYTYNSGHMQNNLSGKVIGTLLYMCNNEKMG